MEDYIGVAPDDVPALGLADPRRSAEHDARRLAALITTPGSTVTAAVYDLETGSVTTTWTTPDPGPA
jgi:hypothetical protein